MSEAITAKYDGKVIVPDTPLELPAGQRLRVQFEAVESEGYPLKEIGKLATDMGVTDLAERHQQYAHPAPKDSSSA